MRNASDDFAAFELDALDDPATRDEAARKFDEDGFIRLRGIGDRLERLFTPIIAERLEVSPERMDEILEPEGPAVILPEATRQRMSRIQTAPELADGLLNRLENLIGLLLGPIVQVSSDFHGQFKGGDSTATGYGGYVGENKFLEVQRPYLIHQDFTGGSIPTSASGITLWTPLNSCPDWTLRVWPGSHRHGMLCRKFPALDDPKLSAFRPHLDVRAERGTAIVFNALVLHATSNPGPRRRLSTDIRFFPLTGFVPSTPRVTAPPFRAIRSALDKGYGPTLEAPRREMLAFLDKGELIDDVPPLSILNWSNYIVSLRRSGPESALSHLERFVNTRLGWDAVDAYLPALHGRTVHASTLDSAWERIRKLDPEARRPDVTGSSDRVAIA